MWFEMLGVVSWKLHNLLDTVTDELVPALNRIVVKTTSPGKRDFR
jgi:hypothetical protein